MQKTWQVSFIMYLFRIYKYWKFFFYYFFILITIQNVNQVSATLWVKKNELFHILKLFMRLLMSNDIR